MASYLLSLDIAPSVSLTLSLSVSLSLSLVWSDCCFCPLLQVWYGLVVELSGPVQFIDFKIPGIGSMDQPHGSDMHGSDPQI